MTTDERKQQCGTSFAGVFMSTVQINNDYSHYLVRPSYRLYLIGFKVNSV